jgi:integrase
MWRYRKTVRLPDGGRERISGTPARNTREAAERAERAHIDRVLDPPKPKVEEKEAPKFEEWFNGRFWTEWVLARKNKPSEVESKRGIFGFHLKKAFGSMRLDEIDEGAIARFRAKLVGRELSEKRINNILAVLSKALRYAHRVRLIDHVPDVGLFRIEQPEIRFWDWDEYARIVKAAAADREPEWLVGVLLAGEAGLRVGEVRGLRWQDVDLVAGTVTVTQQIRKGETGTPKGRTRRTIPMTPALLSGLKTMPEIRNGLVVRHADGRPKKEQECRSAMLRIYKRAGVAWEEPNTMWHRLRHTFATQAAMLGVNPWTLMTWMGHKAMSMTLGYVELAHAHRRPTPASVLAAAGAEAEPDRRIVLMLGARANAPVDSIGRGKELTKRAASEAACG